MLLLVTCMSEPIGPVPPGGHVPPGAGVSTRAAAAFALGTLKSHAGPFIGLAAVVTILQFASSIGTGSLQNVLDSCLDPQSPGQINACDVAIDEATGPLLVAMLFGVLAVLAGVGVQRAALDVTVGITPVFSVLFVRRNLGRYVLFLVVSSVITLIGFIACIAPGILAYYVMQFGAYLVLDRGMGPGKAISGSARLVRDHPSASLIVVLVNLAGLLIGGLFMGIPTLVVLPLVTVFTVHVYRQFLGQV